MRNFHAWTTRGKDRIKREVRVTKQPQGWRFQAKCSNETGWTYYKHPPLEDLLFFIELLERKYARRRASHTDILLAKKLLAEEKTRQS